MQTLLRFRFVVLTVPFLMALPLVVTTAGCGGGATTKVESTPGPTAEETKAQQSYEEIMKNPKKSGAKIVK